MENSKIETSLQYTVSVDGIRRATFFAGLRLSKAQVKEIALLRGRPIKSEDDLERSIQWILDNYLEDHAKERKAKKKVPVKKTARKNRSV